MTDKMTDEQIITALEHCAGLIIETCGGCPMSKGVCEKDADALEKYALDLINRQKTEIDILIRKKETLRDEIAEKDAKIERLKADKIIAERHEKDARALFKETAIQLAQAKSEAYMEFAERFKWYVTVAESKPATRLSYSSLGIVNMIDHVRRELTEKNDKG